MAEPILEMNHISKRFDMTQALDDVSHLEKTGLWGIIDVLTPPKDGHQETS